MNLCKNWKPIIDKLQAKLSTWKSKTLSFGGRLTLITSVLGNLPTYFFSMFKAPKAVTDKLDQIRRRFLWGGDDSKRKIHWVSWDKVVAPKSEGGLGVGTIRTLNTSLLVKWWWRFKTEKNSLWVKVVKGIHNLHNKPHDYLSNPKISGVWNNIAACKNDLKKVGLDTMDVFQLNIKSGDNSLFWYDKWLGPVTLEEKYPSLFELESRKKCLVSDRFIDNQFEAHWKSNVIDNTEIRCINNIKNDLSRVHLEPGEDQWACALDNGSQFTVSLLRKKLEHLQYPNRVFTNF